MTENSSKLVIAMKVLQTVSGRDPARLDVWHKNTCMTLSMFRRGVFNVTADEAEYHRPKQPNQRRIPGTSVGHIALPTGLKSNMIL